MKTPYTFTVLRYVHDAVTGEFVNVGVVLYAPEARFVAASCTQKYQRISHFFGRIEGDYIRSLLRHLERQIERLGRDIFESLPWGQLPGDALACAEQVFPRDDSALQFSAAQGGLTDNPEEALRRLFDRYVDRYRKDRTRTTRHDEDILPIFRKPLEEKALLQHVQPKTISAPDYEHEFPLAWKNGVWNACDAVSFDLALRSDILEKANKWVGRAVILQESREPFKLVLLLGEPRDSALVETARKAENILSKAPGQTLIIREREAERLAKLVEADLREHGSDASVETDA